MKMKKYIVAGLVAIVLMTSGCGKFVRDELITMQNEIDLLYGKIDQMNKSLASLHGIVVGMAANGYIVDVKEIEDGERGGYVLSFRSVTFDENGNITTDDNYTVNIYSGVDGKDGQDASPFVMSVKRDTTDGRWYWFDTQGDDWMRSAEGDRFLVDGKDGKTPLLKVENGFWCISWDGGENWETTEWPAKGKDAEEVFSKAEIFDDRVELTLAADTTVVLKLPRYLELEFALTRNGEAMADTLQIAPGETIPIDYELKGTGADKALLVAGTDGRFKTAIQRDSTTKGTVYVTCPEKFPDGGYIYITVNDGYGRSSARVVHFMERKFKILYGETEYAAGADEEKGRFVTFDASCDVIATCVFPEGVEPWLTAKVVEAESITALTYDILANPTQDARTGVIVVSPKDHPEYALASITVTQAGKPAETGGSETGGGSGTDTGTGTGTGE